MTLLQAPEAFASPASRADAAPTRERILELVRGHAWTPRELGEALGVDRKTAEYHLHALRRAGVVAERLVHGERRFALAHGAPRAFEAAQPNRTRFRVAQLVEQRGLVSLEELAAATGLSRGLAAYHVRRLAAEGIVRVRRLGSRTLVQAKGLAAQAERPVQAA